MNKSRNVRKVSKRTAIVVIIAILILAVSIGWVLYEQSQPVVFEGTITHINNECLVDGTCSVTVDGKNIITGSGLSPQSTESDIYGSAGRSDTGLSIGQYVTVRALRSGSSYTLRSCNDCYIK